MTSKAGGERIAVLETQYLHLNERHDKTDATLAAVEKRLASIESILTKAQGGWRVLVVVGGIAAAVGAASSKLAMWLLSLPWPK